MAARSPSLVDALDDHGRARSARPLRADAARTRAALLKAARQVFERDGYVHAKIADIPAVAGLAHGSFYSHFQGKDDVLAAVLIEASAEMLHLAPAPSPAGDGSDAGATIRSANRAYLSAYRRDRKLMLLMEQVASVDERFRALRLERTRAFIARNTRLIRSLQREGLVDRELDARIAATALSTMVSRTAYFYLALEQSVDFEKLVDTVSRLWINGLGLTS